MGRILQLGPTEEQDLQSVCHHEAAHEVTADAFGLEGTAFVASTDSGVCIHKPGSPLCVAAIAWAGILAEDLLNLRHRQRNFPKVPLPLEERSLLGWFEQCTGCGWGELSAEDRRGIEGHQRSFESLRLSLKVLMPRLPTVKALARLLADEARNRVAANSPEAAEFELMAFHSDELLRLQKRNVELFERKLGEFEKYASKT